MNNRAKASTMTGVRLPISVALATDVLFSAAKPVSNVTANSTPGTNASRTTRPSIRPPASRAQMSMTGAPNASR
jgi:hypothetical protein